MFNGLMINGDSPVISGKWTNPKTGDSFVVKDSFFQDNQYMVTTTDGRMLDYSKLQDYVQMSSKTPDRPIGNLHSKQNSSSDIPAEVLSLIDTPQSPTESQMGIDYSQPKRINQDSPVEQFSPVPPAPQMNQIEYHTIQKALGKHKMPEIRVGILGDIPSYETRFLINTLEISENAIIDYIMESYNIDNIRASIREELMNKLKSIVSDEYESAVQTAGN